MTERPAPRDPVAGSEALRVARDRVEPVLADFLADRRVELADLDPSAAALVDEIARIVAAGGKRIRPALCWWAHAAAGGRQDDAVVRAAAALELLHTFALVHDDVMDGADERRGVPTTHVVFAKEAPPGTEPVAFGTSVAILVGDLAAVLAERLLRTCGARSDRLARALDWFDRARAEMAAGQFLDVSGRGTGPASERVAGLKTGSYTAEGPVMIGAALAGAGADVEGPLRAYARLVGEAFQLRDDVLDGEAPSRAVVRVGELVGRAVASLDGAPLDRRGAAALRELAGLLRLDDAAASGRAMP